MSRYFVDPIHSMLPAIRATSIGGMAHEYFCLDRLRKRASDAIDTLSHHRDAKAGWQQRYGRVLHAAGLTGAVGLRTVILPGMLGLNLIFGTGRDRSTGPECLSQTQKVTYFEALLAHPLDTGLLGLRCAGHLAAHALIAGTVGAALSASVGAVLWPFFGRPRDIGVRAFVDAWIYRGAFLAGVLGALMGSCFVWSSYNYIVLQCLRVLTALPELLANTVGYGAAGLLALVCLLAYDGVAASRRALDNRWPGPPSGGSALTEPSASGAQASPA